MSWGSNSFSFGKSPNFDASFGKPDNSGFSFPKPASGFNNPYTSQATEKSPKSLNAEQNTQGFVPPTHKLDFGVPPESPALPPQSEAENDVVSTQKDEQKTSPKRKQKKERTTKSSVLKRERTLQEKRLQKDIQAAVLDSFNEATPEEAKEIAQSLSTTVILQAQKLAEAIIARRPAPAPRSYQNPYGYNFGPIQSQGYGMVQIPYQQYQQFMQMCYNREAQISQLMQSNAMLMQKLQQMQNEDDDEYYDDSEDGEEEEDEE